MPNDIVRPKRVQAAFDVFDGQKDTGPNAAAMFIYIRQLEAENEALRKALAPFGPYFHTAAVALKNGGSTNAE